MKTSPAPPAVSAFDALPVKQQDFVLAYLEHKCNATEGAKAAGYSAKSAHTQGSRLMATPAIQAAIKEKASPKLRDRAITADRVLDEIAKMAYFDPRRLFTRDGQLVDIQELDDECAAAISGFDLVIQQDGTMLRKVRFRDKGMNLERLGRFLKLFTDKVEHSGSLGVQLITSVPRPDRGVKK